MQDYFASWPQEGTVDLFEKIAELIIMTASRTLMGETSCVHVIHSAQTLHRNLQQHSCMASYFDMTQQASF